MKIKLAAVVIAMVFISFCATGDSEIPTPAKVNQIPQQGQLVAGTVEKNIALANNFLYIKWITDESATLFSDRGDFDVSFLENAPDSLILSIEHNSEIRIIEFMPSSIKMYSTDNALLDDSLNDYFAASLLTAKRLSAGGGDIDYGDPQDPQHRIIICTHLGRNSGCAWQDATAYNWTICGCVCGTVSAGSTSCVWDNHLCVTTWEASC